LPTFVAQRFAEGAPNRNRCFNEVGKMRHWPDLFGPSASHQYIANNIVFRRDRQLSPGASISSVGIFHFRRFAAPDHLMASYLHDIRPGYGSRQKRSASEEIAGQRYQFVVP